jgi:hypothetical protein
MKNAGYLVAFAIAAYFLFRKKPAATTLVAPVEIEPLYIPPVQASTKTKTTTKSKDPAPPVLIFEDPVEQQSAQFTVIGSCDLGGKPGTLVINQWGEEECIDL